MMKSIALCLILPAALPAQPRTTAADRPAFEVASVKPHPPAPGPFRSSTSIETGGINFTNVNLKGCIRAAYEVQPNRISGGPDWIASERYDIVAKAASAVPKARLMLMLQTLLEDRFQLRLHRETKEFPIYALVAGKNGPKIRPGKEDGETEIGGGAHLIDSRGMTMKALAGVLSRLSPEVDRPVFDMTGLTGVFDITLDVETEDKSAADADSGQSILTALQEQLGLKLEPRKGPVEIIVIDQAVKASGN
jgi:uncharacterized protein (TIGR03435 family)